MTATLRSNLVIVSEVLQEAVKGQLAGMVVLAGSPAASISGSLPDTARGGDVIKLPYFSALTDMDDLAAEGDALAPVTISETSQSVSVQHAGKAFSISQWAQIAADPRSDPYTEAGRQLRELIRRRVDKALLDAAIATDAAMTSDVYNASTPRTIDYDLYLAGRKLWGDEQDDIALMVVHSKVLFDMYALKDSTGRPLLIDSIAEGGLPRFLGVPVLTSDRLTATSDSPAKYTSLIIKRNALAFWFNGTPRVLQDTDILADVDVTAVHMYFAAARYTRIAGSTKSGVVLLKHN